MTTRLEYRTPQYGTVAFAVMYTYSSGRQSLRMHIPREAYLVQRMYHADDWVHCFSGSAGMIVPKPIFDQRVSQFDRWWRNQLESAKHGHRPPFRVKYSDTNWLDLPDSQYFVELT